MSESKHVKTYREKHLAPGASIVATAEGYIGKLGGSDKELQRYGSLIITNTAVVFYRKGWFGEINQSIPLDKLTSIEQSSVLGFRGIRLHTSHDDLKFTTQNGDEYKQILAAVEAGRGAKPSAAASAGESPLDTLKKLGELKAAGLLSEAEFDEKKRHLLSRV